MAMVLRDTDALMTVRGMPGLLVRVHCLFRREHNGDTQYCVTPESGEGRAWVNADRFTMFFEGVAQ